MGFALLLGLVPQVGVLWQYHVLVLARLAVVLGPLRSRPRAGNRAPPAAVPLMGVIARIAVVAVLALCICAQCAGNG